MARLLLIDDDQPLRELLALILTMAGHSVIQAGDGRKVLAIPEIDLVITDLVMPQSEGLEVITQLRDQRPSLPVIAISGAPINSQLYLKMAAKLGAHRALTKPIAPEVLLGAVRELLAKPPSPAASP